MSDDVADTLKFKLLKFICMFDSRIEKITTKGVTLTAGHPTERCTFNNYHPPLVTLYFVLPARQADNTAA